VSLRRIVSVVDTGIAVNPDTVIAQLEGGLSSAHRRALRRDHHRQGRVRQSNFHDYRMLRIDQIPKIEVHVVKSGEPPAASQTGANAGPPALRNAIYAEPACAAAAADRPHPARGGEKSMSGLQRILFSLVVIVLIAAGIAVWMSRSRTAGLCRRAEGRACGLPRRQSNRRSRLARQG